MTLICVVDVDFVVTTKGNVILTQIAEPRGFVKLNAYKRSNRDKTIIPMVATL